MFQEPKSGKSILHIIAGLRHACLVWWKWKEKVSVGNEDGRYESVVENWDLCNSHFRKCKWKSISCFPVFG